MTEDDFFKLIEIEGDEYDWVVTVEVEDIKYELDCKIMRHDSLKFWCGYIEIPKRDELYKLHYNDDKFPKLYVHGGVTFTDFIYDKWYIGFDCGHYGDLSIINLKYINDRMGGVYRNKEFVISEVKSLAKQICDNSTQILRDIKLNKIL